MSNVMAGAMAGAVGTLALDITTYADMAIRGRASSDTPAKTIKRMAEKRGIHIENGNRANALGALSGYGVGIGIGVLFGMLRPRVRALPLLVTGIALGAAAMAASDVPATRVGATDPKTWGAPGWIADIVPHAIYGLVTSAAFNVISKPPEN